MHKRLGLQLALGLLASTLVSAQVTVTDTHEGGKPVPKPAPFNMKSATPTQNVSRQGPLTNRNIIQMVKGGQQQSAILATLRSRGGSFDLSPQGCSALRAANVSRTILNAMGGAGGSQCTASMPSRGALQKQPNANGMLLGNQDATLLGGSGGHGAATATPSNGGDPVALNPQPLPPRTGKGLVGSSTSASTASPAGGATKTSPQVKLRHATGAAPATTGTPGQ